MKRPLALLALAGVHYANGQERRALAALASATEDPEFNEAIETVNTAVSDDELPPELDDVVESSDDGDEDDIAAEDLVEDVEALEPEEVEALADGVVEDDELNVDADDLNLDTPEAVVSSLLDAGAAPSTIQRHVRNLLIAGLSDLGADDDGDEDEDDSDLHGFDEEACGGPMRATASVARRRSRNMKDVIAANLKALSR
jgi:hypothetical protein